MLDDPAVREFLRPRVNTVVFAPFALCLFIVSWSTLHLNLDVPPAAMPVCAALTTFPVLFAWVNPVLGWSVCILAAQAIGVLADPVPDWRWSMQVTTIIALMVLTAMVCLRGQLRAIPLVWVATIAAFFYAAPPLERAGWAVGMTALVLVCWLLRVLWRSRRQLVRETQLKEEAAEHSLLLEERARIARDLHDVVAHRMSVVVVQAQTAQYRLPGLPVAAVSEFDAIADVGREALQEVRQMLGVLRVEGEDAPQAPNPTIADIDRLITATRGTGTEVTAHVEVDPDTVGDATSLTTFRIVQESLANITRHAPGADADVAVLGAGDAVRVSVTNSASTGENAGLPAGAGLGIRGMAERAQAVGGTLTATPTADGGFGVHAVLPRSADVRRGAVTATDPAVRR
ncbi:sensor histidine kinase [Williamsia sterculiae]|uniref:histidine kinase n=1 Tax=Williamsia sterculiae TaxID=1344003 RepID=A0A1N7G3V2_9NOCA|nr:histidine kinase [Williamsia sterculiae]SIS07283.1 Signal transduction histidine kinase [Williamsia sterculiae]